MNLRQERDGCATDQRLCFPNAKHEVYSFNPGYQPLKKKSMYYTGYFDNGFWPTLSMLWMFIMQKGMPEEAPNSEFGRGQQHLLGNETSTHGEST